MSLFEGYWKNILGSGESELDKIAHRKTKHPGEIALANLPIEIRRFLKQWTGGEFEPSERGAYTLLRAFSPGHLDPSTAPHNRDGDEMEHGARGEGSPISVVYSCNGDTCHTCKNCSVADYDHTDERRAFYEKNRIGKICDKFEPAGTCPTHELLFTKDAGDAKSKYELTDQSVPGYDIIDQTTENYVKPKNKGPYKQPERIPTQGLL